jgi:HK97 family phage prohead protease
MTSAKTKSKRPVTERRIFPMTNCEVRAAVGDEPAVFSGYAAVFNELSVNLGGFRERIKAGCFRTAVEEKQDVRFLINHDANLMLGRTKSSTVTLTEDEIGLRVECELPNTSYATDLVESMRRKDIDQMSFGFVTRSDAWEVKDAETGLPIRELIDADLFDVSVVAYPAYPDTTAEVRSMIEERTPQLLERAARAADELADVEVETVSTEPETLAASATIAADGAVTVHQHFFSETAKPAADVRVGKTLSQKNADAIASAAEMLQAVLVEAGAFEAPAEPAVVTEEVAGDPAVEAETRETLVRPDMAAFRAALEQRGSWGYDDDWSVWTLTQMIECASCFLLYADDDADEPADVALADGMKTIMSSLAALLAQVVAEGRDAPAAEAEVREEETPAEPPAPGRFDRERRRLALAERELALV